MKNKTDISEIRAVSKKPYYELFRNLLFDFISVRFHRKLFRPLMTNVYITKRCNLRCQYCYPPGDEADMELGVGLALLDKIRPKNPAINFTGGEPLLHPYLAEFIRKARALRFRPILVSTNAYRIEGLIELLPMIDNVIVSLDSMNEEVNDALSGVPGATRSVVTNIRALAGMRRQFNFNISLHTVLCPDNLDDIEHLVGFCDSQHITLSVSPEHVDAYPRGGLRGNPRYIEAIGTLQRLKQAGGSVACSMGYLGRIKLFSEHHCYPFLSPRVEPDGTVYFPCYRIRESAYNLADCPNLYSLMRDRGTWMNNDRDCRNRCFLACYMEVEQYVRNPLRLLRELPFRNLALGRKIKPTGNRYQSTKEQRDG